MIIAVHLPLALPFIALSFAFISLAFTFVALAFTFIALTLQLVHFGDEIGKLLRQTGVALGEFSSQLSNPRIDLCQSCLELVVAHPAVVARVDLVRDHRRDPASRLVLADALAHQASLNSHFRGGGHQRSPSGSG